MGLCHVSLRGACPISTKLEAHGVAGSPKGNFSLTLPFITTEARGSVGPSAYTDTVNLGVWQITVGSGMPCLLPQYLRILWDGHHLCSQKAVSQRHLIYWQDLSRSMWKTAPPEIPPLGKRAEVPVQAACSSGEESACTFQMPHS